MSSGFAVYRLIPFHFVLNFTLEWMQSGTETWTYHKPGMYILIRPFAVVKVNVMQFLPLWVFRNWPEPNKFNTVLHLTSKKDLLLLPLGCSSSWVYQQTETGSMYLWPKLACTGWHCEVSVLPKIICNTAMRGSFHYLGTWQHLVLHEIWVQVLPHLCLGKHFQMLLKRPKYPQSSNLKIL